MTCLINQNAYETHYTLSSRQVLIAIKKSASNNKKGTIGSFFI